MLLVTCLCSGLGALCVHAKQTEACAAFCDTSQRSCDFTKSLTLFYFQDIRIGSEFKNHLHNTH